MDRPTSLTADLSMMRELNRALVLQLVRRRGRISRADIAKQTQLSRSTVSSIIADLMQQHLVTETGIGTSKGGRRPIILEFNYQANYIIGLDVGQTAIEAVITDLNARICHRRTLPFDIGSGPRTGMPRIQQMVEMMLNEAPVGRSRISAIGVGIPAPLNFRTGRTIAPPVMPGWDNIPIREELMQQFGLPVSVDNDANLASMAELRWGAGQGAQNMIYLYLSTSGIGAGLIMDSRLYRGSIGSAGEIGHVALNATPLDDQVPVNAGTLEALASQPVLMRKARQAGFIGPDDDLDALLDVAERPGPARELMEQAGYYIGVAVTGLINMLNPDRVVIGGPMAEHTSLIIERVRSTVARRGLSIAVEHTSIVAGTLGANVVALGAAALATERLFAQPALERPASLGLGLALASDF